MKWSVRNIIGIVMIAVVSLAILGTLGSGMQTVPSGYKGIRLQWGKIVDVLDAGLYFINPFLGESLDLVSVQIQKVDTVEEAASFDVQTVSTTITVNYRLESAYVLDIYRDMRNDYESRVIQPNVEEAIKATTAQFTAWELIQQRSVVKFVFSELLDSRLEQYHIDVLSVSITNFDFSEKFNTEVEATNIMKQRVITAGYELERLQIEQQKLIVQATMEANATRIAAQAAFDKKMLEIQAAASEAQLIGEAKAKAIEALAAAMSKEYLQYQLYLQWDGKLPYYYIVSGNASMPLLLLNLP